MEKRLVLLLRMQPLLAEGLQRILHTLEDVELVCLDCNDAKRIETSLKDLKPAVVLLAGEKEDEQTAQVISFLLAHYEDIPVVWVELEKTTLRLYTSHSLSATSAGLFDAIREQGGEFHLAEKKSNPQD